MGLYNKVLKLTNKYNIYDNDYYYEQDTIPFYKTIYKYKDGFVILKDSYIINYYDNINFPNNYISKTFNLNETSNNYIFVANDILFYYNTDTKQIKYTKDLGDNWFILDTSIINFTVIRLEDVRFINNTYCFMISDNFNKLKGYYSKDLLTLIESPLSFIYINNYYSTICKNDNYLLYVRNGNFYKTKDFITEELVGSAYGYKSLIEYDYGIITRASSQDSSGKYYNYGTVINSNNNILFTYNIYTPANGSSIIWLPNNIILMTSANTDAIAGENGVEITKFDSAGSQEIISVNLKNFHYDTYQYYQYLYFVNNYVIIYGGTAKSLNEQLYEISFSKYNELDFSKINYLNYSMLNSVKSNNSIALICDNNYYTMLELSNITPEERITIYANDYSTITGSQILENAVRSVNHYRITSSIENKENGSFSKKPIIENKPAYKYYVSNNSIKDRMETYTQKITNCKIVTASPIIGDLDSSNFSFNAKNYMWKIQSSDSEFQQFIINKIDSIQNSDEACPITTKDLEDKYGVVKEETDGIINEAFTQISPTVKFEYSVSNIRKINDYEVIFDCDIATKYAVFEYYYEALHYNYALAKIVETQTIYVTLTCNTTALEETQFVFSIDVNEEGQYVQNSPFQRNDNELFLLTEDFFKEQAQAIINTNKDGRMVLTVNTTTDLNLYNGKELTVTMKDGTLANNGATFEVVNIKEKFTGFNWKQVLTLKEKNN